MSDATRPGTGRPPETTGEPPLPEPPGWLRVAVARLLQSPVLQSVLGVLLLGVVSAGVAWVVTPGVTVQDIPYDDRSLGEVATATLKADRDYDIPDEATTQRQRDDAASQVRPVYEFDVAVLQGALARAHAGFALGREAASQAHARVAAVAPDPAVRKAVARGAPEPGLAAPIELTRALEEIRGEVFRELQATLESEDMKALEAAEWNVELERSLESVLRTVQAVPVASSRDELFALGHRGITVRTLSSGSANELDRVLIAPGLPLQPGEVGFTQGPTSIAEVPDLDMVRARIDSGDAVLANGVAPAQRRALLHLARRMVRPNLAFKASETTLRQGMARLAVKPVVIQVKKGDRVLSAGEHVDKHHLVILGGMRSQTAGFDPIEARLGVGLVTALLVTVAFGFGRSQLRRFRPTRKDVLFLGLWLLAMLGLVDAGSWLAEALHERTPALPMEQLAFAIPFPAAAMTVRFLLGGEVALLFGSVFAVLAALAAGGAWSMGAFAWVGSVVAIQSVAQAKDRAAIFRAGLWSGLFGAVAVLGLQLMSGRAVGWETAQGAVASLIGGGLFTPIVVLTGATLAESLGGYVTDIKLLELANLNHPALKELIVQAPGTYHHSIVMGALVEQAAVAIGANPLLSKVCAYFHDIGKGRNALGFGENQKGENPHDRLPPLASAKLIQQHVLDGLALAEQHRLPRAVADAIPQHHGTRLVGFFFHKALKEAEAQGLPPPEEAAFRYPGPKPQCPEAALVMIADACEAASRSLADPSDENLRALVKRMINAIFADGQLDECDLTLRDLNVLAEAFFQALRGIQHARPQYPPGAVNVGGASGAAPLLRAVPTGAAERKAAT